MESSKLCDDNKKLIKLKGLLDGALLQIRRKLAIIKNTFTNIKTAKQITNETKVICSILIEIRESLKHFPASTPRELNTDQTTDKLLQFKNNVFKMIDIICFKLDCVEEFYKTTDSLPKAMTVAITIREITMHLKVISSYKGGKIIHIPGSSKLQIAHSNTSNNIVPNIVDYYSKLSKSPSFVKNESIERKTSAPVVSPRNEQKIEETIQIESNTPKIKESTKKEKKEKRESQNIMEMERAVVGRMETLTKKRGKFMNNLLEDQSINELFEQKTEKPSTSNINRLLESGQVYYSGLLDRKTSSLFGKAVKSFFWVLDTEKISCYQSDRSTIPLKSYLLNDIKHCSWADQIQQLQKIEKLNYVTFIGKRDRKLTLQCSSDVELMKWICAVDTIKFTSTNIPIINPIDKHRLLQIAYKQHYNGGEIKSSYEEDWSYSPDGVLKSEMGLSDCLKYRWDGEMLIGTNEKSRLLGSGKWDGITLIWYDESANGMIATPSVRFDFNQSKGEYTNAVEPSQVWKWTRHFLASKFGAGEWIVEGEIPQPVVMFLQMIRSCRLQKTVNDTEEIEIEIEKKKELSKENHKEDEEDEEDDILI